MKGVNDAVILAAGMGTRMLPASLISPKEALPLVDTPIINHLIWESMKAGVKRIHVVLSEEKYEIMKKFFSDDEIYGNEIRPELPRISLKLGAEGVEIFARIQRNPGGVADAIKTSVDYIDGPFIVLLGDMLMMENHPSLDSSGPDSASSASAMLVSEYHKYGLPCVGMKSVKSEDLANYGVLDIKDGAIVGIVEKPNSKNAPSNWVLCGRYLFPEEMADILNLYPVEEFGELQSIRILEHFALSEGLRGVSLDSMSMYDSGDPVSWLKAQIDHSLRRSDMSDEIEEWIRGRIEFISSKN